MNQQLINKIITPPNQKIFLFAFKFHYYYFEEGEDDHPELVEPLYYIYLKSKKQFQLKNHHYLIIRAKNKDAAIQKFLDDYQQNCLLYCIYGIIQELRTMHRYSQFFTDYQPFRPESDEDEQPDELLKNPEKLKDPEFFQKFNQDHREYLEKCINTLDYYHEAQPDQLSGQILEITELEPEID